MFHHGGTEESRRPFLRGVAEVVLVLDILAVVMGLLALFDGEPATGGVVLAAAGGVGLFAGLLWCLTEICKKLDDISQVLADDICETCAILW